MTKTLGIYIIAEVTKDQKPTSLTLELMGLGKELCEKLGENLFVVLPGSRVSDVACELLAHGAHEVFVFDNPLLLSYNPLIYHTMLIDFFQNRNSKVIMSGHTAIGQDLLPRLAFSLGAGLVTDCVGMDTDDENNKLLFKRFAYGGNVMATQKIESGTNMVTVRAKVGDKSVPSNTQVSGKVTNIEPVITDTSLFELKGREYSAKGIDLEEAPVVVAGGRGMGGEDGFVALNNIATLLGGAVGASRPPVDSGWADPTCQIGITGKIVAPDLYIAVGISGLSQHLTGIRDSKIIVSINKDPEANIFNVCNYGAVGDWKQILPAFTERLKELSE